MSAQTGWQHAGQRGQDRPLGPVRPGTGDLAAQDRDLMTEHHDLVVLRRLAAAQQVQPAKDPDDGEIQKSIGIDGDLASSMAAGQNAGHSPCAEFWSSTGTRAANASTGLFTRNRESISCSAVTTGRTVRRRPAALGAFSVTFAIT
jgi:hypothetical protein